jgi:transposase
MSKLIENKEQKVFLILDNLRVHHSKIVKQWAEDNKEKIELFYLPSYSPEKNPDEYLAHINFLGIKQKVSLI